MNSNSIVSVDNISIHINNVIDYSGSSFPLNVSLHCGGLNWDFILPIDIHYGQISIVLELLSDQNNNMVLDPGEIADFKVIVNNNGYILCSKNNKWG